MGASRKKIKLKETKRIKDIAKIMSAGQGPYTKMMLVIELEKIYPDLYLQELKNLISYAIEEDKHIKKRFRQVKPGWWDLA